MSVCIFLRYRFRDTDLDTVNDSETTTLVDLADVTAVDPAVCVNGGLGIFRILKDVVNTLSASSARINAYLCSIP